MIDMDRRAAKTLAEDVYRDLREEILTGRLRTGDRLFLSELAKARGVSLSVVREAVIRLASERLLEAIPQVGFRVRVLSVEDLVDLTRVRIEIETLALRDSIAGGDLEWEARLVAAHHALAATPDATDRGELSFAWLTRHAAFHEALCAGCTSRWLLDLRAQLFAASELYRFWIAEMHVEIGPQRFSKVIGQEHKALLDAALGRDAEAAAELIANHLQTTCDVIRANAERLGLASTVEAQVGPTDENGD
jgi:DNA-binding GntR family transcriptional regulator